MFLCWHAGFLEDSFDLELLDFMDRLVEKVLKFALDDLFLCEEIVDEVDSAFLGFCSGF